VSARKPSKTLRRKTSVGGSRAGKTTASVGGELTPLAYLLYLMNDETVPDRQRGIIAAKIAPYCHPKLKRAANELPDTFIENDATGTEDGVSDADQRERIRKRIFQQFD